MKKFSMVWIIALLFSGCSHPDASDMRSADAIEQYLEMAYDMDFSLVEEDDSLISEWLCDNEAESARGYVFADENGLQFTAIAYRARQLFGSCPAVKENYRSVYALDLMETIEEISRECGVTIRLHEGADSYMTRYDVLVDDKTELEDALHAVEKMQKIEMPVLAEPDVQIGMYSLLWYSTNCSIHIMASAEEYEKSIRQYFFLTRPEYEAVDYDAELYQLQRAYDTADLSSVVTSCL